MVFGITFGADRETLSCFNIRGRFEEVAWRAVKNITSEMCLTSTSKLKMLLNLQS